MRPGTRHAESESPGLAGRVRQGVASLYRRTVLRSPTFIVVTGSCGKTTTKELIATVLSARGRGYRSPRHCNSVWHVTGNVLKTRPWHRFSVTELPGAGATLFPLDDLLDLIRPTISVVTTVGQDHYTVFRSLDAVAAHKGKVVDCLGPDGVAILNADDPRVMAMRSRCAGRVILCGTSAEATIRASELSSAWPGRLSMQVTAGPESVRVRTQLCGSHWAPNVLMALAVGQVMGIPLEEAAAALEAMPPFPGRMSPHVTADGITFIRDDDKAPLWTLPATLEFARQARAPRKIFVIGTLSDFPGTERPRIMAVSKDVLECVDMLVAVGPQGPYHLRAAQGQSRPVSAWANADQARNFLRGVLEPGDLVILKGSEKADKLERIALQWQPRDGAAVAAARPLDAGPQRPREVSRVVVGLGNPAPRYAASPHNVGYRTVEQTAARLGASWVPENGHLAATASIAGSDVRFLKVGTSMNDVGESLARYVGELGLAPTECIVIHDDVDLPPGVLRWRARGSAGGHRGLSSVLVAMQSDEVPRLKIGVGRPESGTVSEFVLAPMEDDRAAVVGAALDQSVDLLMQILTSASPVKDCSITVKPAPRQP